MINTFNNAYKLDSKGCVGFHYDQLEKVSMGHGCPRLLFLFHLQLNIGYKISEQDTIYILQTEFITKIPEICTSSALTKIPEICTSSAIVSISFCSSRA